MVKNAKMEKSNLSLNTYVQYVEDFKFWVMVAGNAHRQPPDKEVVKRFVSGLKPDIFREEICSRSFETLDVMVETRHELFNYRNIIEISVWIKRPEVKKESKDRTPEAHISKKSGNYTEAHTGAPLAKDSKVSNSRKTIVIKDVECFKYHKKGHYANKCRDEKAKDGKGFFLKVRQLEEPSAEKKDQSHSDLNSADYDPFLRY